MARVTNIFALQPAGNVPASKLDVNFEECASYPTLDVESGLNYAVVAADDGHTKVRTNASPMGDTLPTPTGTGGNFPVGFEVAFQALTNTVTITPIASTINGAASLVVSSGSSVVVNTDGTNWYAQAGTSSSASIPGITRQVKTSAYTLISGDKGTMVEATANSWTLDFTTAATLGADWWCYVKNSGTGEIVLEPFGAQTIDGLTNYKLYPNECRLLLCDGSNFFTTIIAPGYQVYSANGTFTKPPGASVFAVMGRAAGGGGGGARGGSAASVRNGGGGGGGGGACYVEIPAGLMGATESVTIGAGGTSGAGGSAGNGSNGGIGGNTTFGTTAEFLKAFGGGGGVGGTNVVSGGGGGGGGTGAAGAVGSTNVGGNGGVSGTAGLLSSVSNTNKSFTLDAGGDGGGSGTNTISKTFGGGGGAYSANDAGGAGTAGGGSWYGGGAGGSGGGVTSGNAESVGGAGGATPALTTGSGGTAGAVNGGAGGAGASGSSIKGGAGGGGGGSQDSGTGGVGGVGGIGGGGGGGGGAGTTVGGAGGVGGVGSLIIWWW